MKSEMRETCVFAFSLQFISLSMPAEPSPLDAYLIKVLEGLISNSSGTFSRKLLVQAGLIGSIERIFKKIYGFLWLVDIS